MLTLSLLAGCSGTGTGTDPASDYLLTLIPAPLGSQGADILDLEPDVKVRLTSPEGEHEVFFAGTAREGEALDLTELPPVPADTRVALIAEMPGGPTDEWNRAATIAYGEALLTEDLALGGEEVSLTIPWVRVDSVGRLGALAQAERRTSAAIVRIGDASGTDGAILVFGGGNPDGTETFVDPDFGAVPLRSSATVLELEQTDGAWSSVFVDAGTLPATWHGLAGDFDTGGFVSARNSGMTATVVTVDGAPQVLVAGGRYSSALTSYQNPYWFLWDPASGEVAGGGVDADEGDTQRPEDDPGCVAQRSCGELNTGRSDHVAVPLGANKVLLYGGMNGLGLPLSATYEIWNGATREIQGSGTMSGEAPFWVAAAQLGTSAVVCGGAKFDSAQPDVDRWVPTDRCVSFRPNDSHEDIASLPVTLAAAALAPLPDGGLLITGGFDEAIEEAKNLSSADTRPASGAAWRWDPDADEWSPVGDLQEPRAYHAALPLADGRVVLIGGAATASTLYGPVADPVRCAEIFDPKTDTFTSTGCNEAGSGGRPAVGGDAVTGWAVLEGFEFTSMFDEDGGAVYGLVGGQPLE
jgi:hypothetical protein